MCYPKIYKPRQAAMSSRRLTAFFQYLGTPVSRGASYHTCMGDLQLLPAPWAPFAPTTSAEVVLHSSGPREHLKPFLLGPPWTLHLHSPAPQGSSASALLPPAGCGVAMTVLGLGQQEVRPKGQQTVGSRPHTRASRLRIQLCFHGNVQSRGSMVPFPHGSGSYALHG